MNWLIAAGLLLAVALVTNMGLLAYALYALVGTILVSRWMTRFGVGDLAATRECNRLECRVGESVAVVVRVENRGRWPVLWALWEDLLPRTAFVHSPPSLKLSGSATQLAMLRAGQSKTLNYQLACQRRGYYQIGPLVLETGDLFGLHRQYRAAAEPQFLQVLPEIVPLAGYDVASRRPIGEVRMTYRLFEDPTRIAGVRPYERGDALNRLHWKATARTGTLHSKVYEPSTVAGATILLDFHRDAHDPRHEPFRSELAITAAASIANALYEMNQQVGLVTNARDAADRIRQEGWSGVLRTRAAAVSAGAMDAESTRLRPQVFAPQRGPEQFARLLGALARAELTDGLTLPQLVLETASRLPRDATVLAILPRATEEGVIALETLARRGFSVAVVLNVFDPLDYERHAAPLVAAGLAVHQLRDREQIAEVCRRQVLRV